MFYTNTDRLDNLMKEAFKDWPLWKTEVTTKGGEYHSEKTDDGYVLELPVPGLTKEDLKLKIVKGRLEISCTNEDNKWVGSFTKTFILPDDVDTKNIKASVENGVLSVKFTVAEDSENIIRVI